MKITDQIAALDRQVIIIQNGLATEQLAELLEGMANRINLDFVGTGSPETVITAPLGSTYRNLNGGAGTTYYVKETEVSTPDNVGWVGK